MKKITLFAYLLLSLSINGCKNQDKPESKTILNTMKSHISLFEIPATDISRAVDFYQAILGITIEKMELPELGMEMGIFPYEDQMVNGVIMKAEGNQPSPNRVIIYLNGGDNLQHILDKIEINGGKIILPKTAHADESGYFALFLDTVGNKLGLNSPN